MATDSALITVKDLIATRQRALELAAEHCGGGRSLKADDVVETAGKFADFILEDTRPEKVNMAAAAPRIEIHATTPGGLGGPASAAVAGQIIRNRNLNTY